MNGRDAIQTALGGTKFLFNTYLSDLADDDLLVRPVPGANHTAWQIGHLISSEIFLIKAELPDASYPQLPVGFDEAHSPEKASKDGPDGFLTKAGYLSLFESVRSVTSATLAKLSDADLSRPTTGRMAKFAPTLGAIFLMVSNHTLMHAGQFTVVRRKLGKPVLF